MYRRCPRLYVCLFACMYFCMYAITQGYEAEPPFLHENCWVSSVAFEKRVDYCNMLRPVAYIVYQQNICEGPKTIWQVGYNNYVGYIVINIENIFSDLDSRPIRALQWDVKTRNRCSKTHLAPPHITIQINVSGTFSQTIVFSWSTRASYRVAVEKMSSDSQFPLFIYLFICIYIYINILEIVGLTISFLIDAHQKCHMNLSGHVGFRPSEPSAVIAQIISYCILIMWRH